MAHQIFEEAEFARLKLDGRAGPLGGAGEKIEFEIRVAREDPTIEHMAMHLKQSMRVLLVANVKSADFAIDFTRVDPKYPPVMTRVKGDAKVSMLLVARLSPNVDLSRQDFERVVPYDDRFQVSIGPLNVQPLWA